LYTNIGLKLHNELNGPTYYKTGVIVYAD